MNNMSTFIQGLREQIGGHSSYPLATFLDRKTRAIDLIIGRMCGDTAASGLAAEASLVAKLREYREALITAAVTGQLDIPTEDAE